MIFYPIQFLKDYWFDYCRTISYFAVAHEYSWSLLLLQKLDFIFHPTDFLQCISRINMYKIFESYTTLKNSILHIFSRFKTYY